MQRLGTIEEAKAKVLNDARHCMEQIRNIANTSFETSQQAVEVLQSVRSGAYENLNQIQHEHLVLCAVEWLLTEAKFEKDTQWYWNPRQTGGAEPDLIGRNKGITVVSAEITTSAKPNGVIDSRMRKTLIKLSEQEGSLYYFVQTQAMANRATTKIRKVGWAISVIQLP